MTLGKTSKRCLRTLCCYCRSTRVRLLERVRVIRGTSPLLSPGWTAASSASPKEHHLQHWDLVDIYDERTGAVRIDHAWAVAKGTRFVHWRRHQCQR